MAEIVNLQRARKSRARADKTAQARENRTRFGRTKAEKHLDATREDRGKRDHAGHRLTDGDPE